MLTLVLLTAVDATALGSAPLVVVGTATLAFASLIAVGVAEEHAAKAMTLIVVTMLKIIFRFMRFSPFLNIGWSIAVQCLDGKEMV